MEKEVNFVFFPNMVSESKSNWNLIFYLSVEDDVYGGL